MRIKFGGKHIVAILLILAVLAAICILNLRFKIYGLHFSSSNTDESETISLMTFNVNAYVDTLSTNKKARLLELIEAEKPDILCFQELSFDNLKKIKPQLDSIYGACESLRGDNQLWRLRFYTRYNIRNFTKYSTSNSIDTMGLDSLELAYYTSISKQMPIMSAEFEVEPGQWIKLFSGHLRSSGYSTARRSMSDDTNWFEGLSLYKRNYEVGKRIRDYEAENVRRFVEKALEDDLPVLVAGDLNDWSGSNCLNTLCEGSNVSDRSKVSGKLKDAWWEGGNGFGWTYFGWHLRLRLDHILYSDELDLVDVRVIDSDLSDHKPLVARFRVK